MKRFIKCIVFVLCLVMFCGSILPCQQIKTIQAANRLNRYYVELVEGKTFQLKLKPNSKKKITWTSKNKKIATVSKKGLVTAVKASKTKITVKQGKEKFICDVKVIPDYMEKVSYDIVDYTDPFLKESYHILKINNENKCRVSVDINIKKYDKDGYCLSSSKHEEIVPSCGFAYSEYSYIQQMGNKSYDIDDEYDYKIEIVSVQSLDQLNITCEKLNEEYHKYIGIFQDYVLTNNSKDEEKCTVQICYYNSNNEIVHIDWYGKYVPSKEKIKFTTGLNERYYNEFGVVKSEIIIY